MFEDLPVLDPVIAGEAISGGWRGLTRHGEVLSVRSKTSGVPVGTDLLVTRQKRAIGRRMVSCEYELSIDDYVSHFDAAVDLFKANEFEAALREFDAAIALAPTTYARFNRGLVLLSMGRWEEGLEDYEARVEMTESPLCQGLSMPRWRGEDLKGKRILLVHDAGFGDTIQQLRYVDVLREMGAEVGLLMPPELERMTDQLMTQLSGEADYFSPMLSLLHLLRQDAETIPNKPYLSVDPALAVDWRRRLGESTKRRVGIAWQVGKQVLGDFPRAIDVAELVAALPDVELVSIQSQDRAAVEALGVRTFDLEDFADCAALISVMDEIVTIDTAAAHVAGAIGHPKVTVLLSHWASWRWVDNPFYPWFRLLRQASPGDWSGALRQL